MRCSRKNIYLLLLLLSCKHSSREFKVDLTQKNNPAITSLRVIADSLFWHDHYSDAIKYFDTLIKLDPSNGQYYFRRGYSYVSVYKKPQLKIVIEDYTKAAELGYEKSDAYYNLGLSYIFENDSTALFYFEKSLKINPNKAIVFILLEQCKERLEDQNVQAKIKMQKLLNR